MSNKKRFLVIWSTTAQHDLVRINEYISQDSKTQARQIYAAINQKVNNLIAMPLQGKIVPELQFFNIVTYRELIIASSRIIYKIDENRINIIAVIDGRRNVEDVLLDRLMQ